MRRRVQLVLIMIGLCVPQVCLGVQVALWEFDEPAGTPLSATTNSTSTGANWTADIAESSTDGAGAFRINRTADGEGFGLNHAWAGGWGDNVETGIVTVDIRISRFSFTGSTHSLLLYTRSRFPGFAESPTIVLRRDTPDTITLEGSSLSSENVDIPATTIHDSDILSEPLTLRLKRDLAVQSYEVLYRFDSDSDFVSLGTAVHGGRISFGRIDLVIDGDFSEPGEYFDIDSISVNITEPPALEVCYDNLDNDGDGFEDWRDTDCQTGTGFYWPTDNPTTENTWLWDSCAWSGNDDYFTNQYHTGNDIPAVRTDRVYPIADGDVVYVSNGLVYMPNGLPYHTWGVGNQALFVRHTLADGESTFLALYGHIRPFDPDLKDHPTGAVDPPVKVTATEAFAEIGPWQYGDHLHLGALPVDEGVPSQGPFGRDDCPPMDPDPEELYTNGFIDPIYFMKTNSPDPLSASRAELPPGFVAGSESANPIDQGQSQTTSFFNGFLQQLWAIVGWGGSEFLLRVYTPSGALYGQYQSDTPPIVVSIPDADTGQWEFEITAVDVPTTDYPYALLIGVPGSVKVPTLQPWARVILLIFLGVAVLPPLAAIRRRRRTAE